MSGRRAAQKLERKENKEEGLAGTTGLEPATSDVTGRRSNQLNYVPAFSGRDFILPRRRARNLIPYSDYSDSLIRCRYAARANSYARWASPRSSNRMRDSFCL